MYKKLCLLDMYNPMTKFYLIFKEQIFAKLFKESWVLEN